MRLLDHRADLGKGEIPAQGAGIETGGTDIDGISTCFQGGLKGGKTACRGKEFHGYFFIL